MSCNTAFLDYISNCTTAIRVNALLIPATPYTWVITDKFGNEYAGESITDSNGFFDILVSDLPAGLLTVYSGTFKLQVYETPCVKTEFKMAKTYDAIEFTISGGTRIKDTIGCDFSCTTEGGGPGNSAVFPFTDISTLTIPWTDFLKSLYGSTPTVQCYIEGAPGEYQLANVAITLVGGAYDLTEIDVDLGGLANGYLLVS